MENIEIIRSNFLQNTFDLKKGDTIYRTLSQIEEDFNNMLYYSPFDWQNYLKTEQDYYIIK